MGLLESFPWRCWSCDSWGLAVDVGGAVLAGAAGGLAISVALPAVRRLGAVGQYPLGIFGAWVAIATAWYFRPFVRDSFFYWRPGYRDLVVPAAILGTVATFELRRRYKRFRERIGYAPESGAGGEVWLATVSLVRQTSFIFLALLLGRSASDLWYRYVAPRETAESYTQAMREAAASNPNDPDTHYYLARGLMELRDWDAALPAAQKALEMDSSIPAYHEAVAWALLGSTRTNEALIHFKRAAEMMPDDPRTWRDLARVAHLAGENGDALTAYEHLNALTRTRILWPPSDREAWDELHNDGGGGE